MSWLAILTAWLAFLAAGGYLVEWLDRRHSKWLKRLENLQRGRQAQADDPERIAQEARIIAEWHRRRDAA